MFHLNWDQISIRSNGYDFLSYSLPNNVKYRTFLAPNDTYSQADELFAEVEAYYLVITEFNIQDICLQTLFLLFKF